MASSLPAFGAWPVSVASFGRSVARPFVRSVASQLLTVLTSEFPTKGGVESPQGFFPSTRRTGLPLRSKASNWLPPCLPLVPGCVSLVALGRLVGRSLGHLFVRSFPSQLLTVLASDFPTKGGVGNPQGFFPSSRADAWASPRGRRRRVGFHPASLLAKVVASIAG